MDQMDSLLSFKREVDAAFYFYKVKTLYKKKKKKKKISPAIVSTLQKHINSIRRSEIEHTGTLTLL